MKFTRINYEIGCFSAFDASKVIVDSMREKYLQISTNYSRMNLSEQERVRIDLILDDEDLFAEFVNKNQCVISERINSLTLLEIEEIHKDVRQRLSEFSTLREFIPKSPAYNQLNMIQIPLKIYMITDWIQIPTSGNLVPLPSRRRWTPFTYLIILLKLILVIVIVAIMILGLVYLVAFLASSVWAVVIVVVIALILLLLYIFLMYKA